MKSIVYIVPYFGKLPKNIELWLLSCKMNKSINWIIITDDKTQYDYPKNVRVIYSTFDNIKKKIQTHFDFDILLDRPWKICDYRPAFGEIFKEEIKEFDFWGYCDMDLIWGDIRKFITNDILEKYQKIGFQGHSTIYKNTQEVNSRYKTEFNGMISYKKVFTGEKGFCFDEVGIGHIYDELKIPYYQVTNFAHLKKYEYGFFLGHLPKEDDYKNKQHILVWDNGHVYRYYIKNDKILKDEFMYIHFFCRPITYKIKQFNEKMKYVFYPDVAEELKENITIKYIRKKSKRSKFKYYAKSFWYNRKKITFKRIIENTQRMLNYKKNKEANK